MCRNHDQLHYHTYLRQAASLLANGDEATRDALLLAATHIGLSTLAAIGSHDLSAGVKDLVRSRLAAVKAESELQHQLLLDWYYQKTDRYYSDEEPPF